MSESRMLKITLLFEKSKEEYRGFYAEDKIKMKEIHIRETIRKALEEKSIGEFHLVAGPEEETIVIDGTKLIGFSTLID